jgi:ABC-type taurine transport system substrate-binding protein
MINEAAERKNSTIRYQQRLEPAEVTFADGKASNCCIKPHAISM